MNWYKTAAFSQKIWSYDFADYQRWVVDGYEVKVYLTSMPRQNVVSMQVYNWHDGSMKYQQFWKFGTDDSDVSKCKNIYNKVINVCKEVIDLFTNGENESAPSCLITTYLKKRTYDIDKDSLARSNIPHINYAIDKGDYTEDWRHSIYGNRYPQNPTSGF